MNVLSTSKLPGLIAGCAYSVEVDGRSKGFFAFSFIYRRLFVPLVQSNLLTGTVTQMYVQALWYSAQGTGH